jgi:glycosyltransferase involved in cell wall biosynthesis
MKQDDRIILINRENKGLPYSLNEAIDIAKGEYIARMDADDIALVDRLKIQKIFLDNHKDISLVGSSVYKIDENGIVFGIMNPPFFEFDNLKKLEKILLSGRTLAFHPTWMVRKELYEKLGGYRPFKTAQDYEFLWRVIDFGYKIANIKKPLLKYRINSKNISFTKSIYQYKSAIYAVKLHKEREKLKIDNFNEEEYLQFLKTSKFMEKIHLFSTKMFLNAINYKNNKKYFLFLFYLLSSLVSPYQVRRIVLLIRGKLYDKN